MYAYLSMLVRMCRLLRTPDQMRTCAVYTGAPFAAKRGGKIRARR